MNFKSALAGFLILTTPLLAEEAPSLFPMGIVIRPGLLNRLASAINDRSERFAIEQCIQDWPIHGFRSGFKGTISLKLDPIVRWETLNSQTLEVEGRMSSLSFQGSIFQDCNSDSRFSSAFEMTLSAPAPLLLWIQPQAFKNLPDSTKKLVHDTELPVRLYPLGVPSEISQLEIKLSGAAALAQRLDALKSIVANLVIERANQWLSVWLARRLHGLAYTERFLNILESQGLSDQINFQKGGLRISNPRTTLRRQDLAFGFVSRPGQSLFLNNFGMEFYLSALFMNQSERQSFTRGLQNTEAFDSLENLRRQLLQLPPTTEAFQRPQLPQSPEDLSIFVTEDFFNHALQKVYQTDLLQFSTSIHLGETAKNLVTREVPDVQFRVDLGSPIAPQLHFEANHLRLSVSDYFLTYGTEIKDRLIPASELKAQVEVATEFEVSKSEPGSPQTLNLLIQPDSFRLQLAEAGRFKRKFSDADLVLFQRIAGNLWQQFFSHYPRLVLMPTLIETNEAQFVLSRVEVNRGLILLHMNLDERSIQF